AAGSHLVRSLYRASRERTAASMKLIGLIYALTAGVLVASITAAPLGGKRVLVLLQSEADRDNYSQFLDSLAQLNFDITVRGHKDKGIKLKEYDHWNYDHLILFAPKAESFGGSIDVPALLDFVDSGRNVIFGASSDVSDTMRGFAAEVGVDMDEKGSKVFDHFNHASIDGRADHTLVISTEYTASSAGIPTQGPILYRGVGCSVAPDSELVAVALGAPTTAYSFNPRGPPPEAGELMAGSGLALVALVQARNNARVLVSGSMDLFTNQLFNAQVVRGSDGAALGTSGNAAFALSVARWALQDRGVLEAEGLQHRLVAAPLGSPAPSHYRVLDDVEFSVKLWEREAGARRPYLADDVQVEFTMLDPHVRLPLSHDGQGNFSVRFKVPDVYGVFKYVLTYRRPGYSYVDLVQQAPVSTEGDYGAVRSAVANILDKDDYDDGSFGPVLVSAAGLMGAVRLAWHASGTYDKASNTGGSNGSTMRFPPECEHNANAGLKVARDLLDPVKERFPWISYADLWTLAGCVAVEEMGGPHIKWRPGRKDHVDASSCPPDKRLPDASQGAAHIRAIFNRMGFNDQEIVALSGAHALGRCHTDRSGYTGPWTNAPTTFSNLYFQELLNRHWRKKSWSGPLQYEDKESGKLMMLPTDMALIQDRAFKKWTQLYAQDEQRFFDDFAAAFQKLLELGVNFPVDGPLAA
ncbi:hypothetical protein QJQ45_022972, partial [Haematococcus lacustris]